MCLMYLVRLVKHYLRGKVLNDQYAGTFYQLFQALFGVINEALVLTTSSDLLVSVSADYNRALHSYIDRKVGGTHSNVCLSFENYFP